jgi:hypothetical protein
MILGVTMIATCEAFALADKLGLDRQAMFDVVSTSSGYSWSMNAYCPAPGVGPTKPADNGYKPGFAADLMLKDLRLSQQAAEAADADTPMGARQPRLYRRFVEDEDGSGNSAFDAYKADTLRRLEEEQDAFEAFLQRLRDAKDKAEFDQFMDDRAARPGHAPHASHRAAVLCDGSAALPLSRWADGAEAVHRAAGRPGREAEQRACRKQGFRRSQNVLYRPSCTECAACLSARIRVADFTPRKSQRGS